MLIIMKPASASIRLRRDVVQALREARGLGSDTALAQAMGVNRSSVSRVLRGVSQPGPRFIAHLCVALGAPMHELFTLDA